MAKKMKYLVVPMQLDALVVDAGLPVVWPKTDYSHLPFRDQNHIVHHSWKPYLHETVESGHFGNDTLNKGIHLHWKFPIEFTHGVMERATGTQNHLASPTFPPLPDRWLIKKKKGTTALNIWYLESSALRKSVPFYQIGHTTTIPFDDKEQPFRFLGNYHQLFPTPEVAVKINEYYDDLTAELAGDQTFTSQYQNCKTVFGFHDLELTSNIEYEIVGWYADSKKDAEARKALKNQGTAKVVESDWLDYDSILKNKLLFYSTVEIHTLTGPIAQNKPDKIGVGWTGTQAFSALISGNDDALERSLEEVLLSQKFESSKLDREDLFDQAFHEKGFSAISGGHAWKIGVASLKENAPAVGQKGELDTFQKANIPESIAHLLNQLNSFQSEFDSELITFGDMRDQLFADWHKYMEASHYYHHRNHNVQSHNGIPWDVEAKMERTFHSDNLLGLSRKSTNYVWADNTLTEKIILPNPKEIEVYFKDFHFDLLDRKIEKINSIDANVRNTLTQLEKAKFDFNSSGNPNPAKLPSHLISEHDYTVAAGLPKKTDYSINSTDPNTAGLAFITLDGQKQKLTISGVTNEIHAISCWVKIESHSSDLTGTFIQIKKNPESKIGPVKIGSEWCSIVINGVRVDPYRNAIWKDIPKGRWIHFYGLLNAKFTNSDVVLFEKHAGSVMKLRMWNRPLSEKEIFHDTNMLGLHELKISADKGPRYWQPNNPVILIEGDIAESKPRKSMFAVDKDNNLDIGVLKNCIQDCEDITQLKFPDLNLGKNYQGKVNPWNPIMLEWEVQNNSISHLVNNENYTSSSITDHYLLGSAGPDFVLENGVSNAKTTHLNLISGSTILSPHAKKRFQHEKETIDTRLAEIKQKISDLKIIKKSSSSNAHVDEILRDAIETENDLVSIANLFPTFNSKHFLSQALDGYNNALLMRNQSPQLKVMDPLADGARKAFIEKVDNYLKKGDSLIGESGHWSPLPETAFIPITTGTVGIDTLRMIDAFGRYLDIAGNDVIVQYSRTFRSVGNDRLIPARMSQPSRLQFRWMSANFNELQMNDNPTSSPVCGWLLPNNISLSIDVYDANGSILGILNFNGKKPIWEAAPGNNNVVELKQIPNIHLKKVVGSLLSSNSSLIELLDSTLEKIDPENFAQHLDLAVLVGRPIAIVRASVKYELRGLPAVQQDWMSFIDDIQEYKPRSTRGFEKVKIPIRIGEPGRLNDGILGFWKDSNKMDTFYSVVENGPSVPNVEYRSPSMPNLEISHDDPREDLTLLFDPRGTAHVACGVVPVKAISIPDHMFKPALKNLKIPFFVRPLLNAGNSTALPLPIEDGYNWSWLVQEKNKWKEVSTIGTLYKETFVRKFYSGQQIWTELIKLNWIREINIERALVNPKEERQGNPSSLIKSQESKIQQLLDDGRITEPDVKAVFASPAKANEGWLQLNQNDNTI